MMSFVSSIYVLSKMKRINLPADLENIFLAVIVYKSTVFHKSTKTLTNKRLKLSFLIN